MKAGWEVKPLGELTKTVTGNTPPKSAKENYGNYLRFVKPPELFDGPVFDTADGLSELGAEKARIAPKGSVLVSCIGNLGKIGLLSEDAAFNQQINAVEPNPNAFLPEYFFYYCLSDDFKEQLAGVAGGTTVPIVNKSRFNSLNVPIPPLEEQKQIVAVLDAAFEGLNRAKENAEANLQNARELFESFLNLEFSSTVEEFGTVEVSELMDSIVDCVNKTAPKAETETPFKMVRTSNIRNGRLDLSSVNYVTEATFETWTRRQLPQRNDVLLTREAPMGEAALVDTDDQIFLGQRVVSYRTNSKKMLPKFLLFSFLSNFLQDQFIDLGSGSTVQHIRVPHTKTLRVPNPPVEVQDHLVEAFSKLRSKSDELIATYTTKLTDIADLRQSLLQKAFAGELT